MAPMHERLSHAWHAMTSDWIFWKAPLRIAGAAAPGDVLARIHGQVTAGRFGIHDRLSGRVEGTRVRVWRRAAIAASDVVQFDGEVRPHADGTVIEGLLSYTLATRAQFLGSLVLGLGLLAGGVVDWFRGVASGSDLLGAGGAVLVLATIWIYSSTRLRARQIKFLESSLTACAQRV